MSIPKSSEFKTQLELVPPLPLRLDATSGGLSRMTSKRSISVKMARKSACVSSLLRPSFNTAWYKNFSRRVLAYTNKSAGVTAAKFILMSLALMTSSMAAKAFIISLFMYCISIKLIRMTLLISKNVFILSVFFCSISDMSIASDRATRCASAILGYVSSNQFLIICFSALVVSILAF